MHIDEAVFSFILFILINKCYKSIEQCVSLPNVGRHVLPLPYVGPRWAPCCPHKPCSQGSQMAKQIYQAVFQSANHMWSVHVIVVIK